LVVRIIENSLTSHQFEEAPLRTGQEDRWSSWVVFAVRIIESSLTSHQFEEQQVRTGQEDG
jgi:hypothetical protein